MEQMSKELLTIALSYEDSNSKYNEHIDIDLKQYFWALYESPTEDVYQEMKKQTKEVSQIRKELHTISINTQKDDDHA